MKKFIFIIIILSTIYPRQDCIQKAGRDALDTLRREWNKHTHVVSDSGYFYIWYDTTGTKMPDLTDNNENGIPDYVDEVGTIADSARHVLVNLMGFSAPPLDEDSIYDIYIKNYPSGRYGENWLDNPSQNESGATSYLLIDNDYSGFNSIFGLSGIEIMRISLGHEYFHGIQFGYGPDIGDSFFYEMTSMWFEDVLIPNGNDYLETKWTDDLLENPTAAFDNTGDGYELALFGHYLSSFIDLEGLSEDEKNSSIMREIWERYRYCNPTLWSEGEYTNYTTPDDCEDRSALSAVNYVLDGEPPYGYTFIEAWVDFISRNLYNGIDESFYYYSDQALIDPIQTYPQTLEFRDTLILSLDNKSAAIQSYQPEEGGLLGFDHLSDNYLGRFAIVSTSDYNNLFWGTDTAGLELISDSEIHFVYGSETQGSVMIDILYDEACGLREGGSLWPGNTNADSLVNADDIVPIIKYWGAMDICKRSLVADGLYQWSAQPLLENILDEDDNCIVYADANGDGKVDIADILAIMINWEKKTSNNDGIPYVIDPTCSDTTGLDRYYSNFSQIYNSLAGNSSAEIQMRSRLEELFDFKPTPQMYKIHQNYPNPFNPTTSIPFYLSKKSEVSLLVFDLLGREVIQDGPFIISEGTHEININGQNLTSGLYLYKFTIDGNEFKPKKMVLLK